MGRTADAVVIGAGIIGAAVAFELAKRGYRVVGIDRNPGAGHGSTSSSSACVRAHYSSRDAVALAYEGFACWRNWREHLNAHDELGLAPFVNCGTVLLNSDDGLHRVAAAHYRELGVEHEEWDLDTLRQRIPYYDTGRYWPPARPSDQAFWKAADGQLSGAIFTPGSGYVSDPQLAAHNLQQAAEAAGARFTFKRRVVAIDADDRVRGVRLDDGEQISAPVVVNAAGPHSSLINRMAGVAATMNIKTRPMRHEVHIVPAPAGLDITREGYHTADGDLGIYFRPEAGNTIIVGSEDPPCDPREWVDDPDRFDRHITRANWETHVYRLARRIPSLAVPNERRGLADLYDVSDDWLPIYDRSDLPGFYLAIGTSGHQFKTAPVVGHVMAELIDACQNGHDHDADPLHLQLPYTGLSLNLGFFSRNRAPSPHTSMSVNA